MADQDLVIRAIAIAYFVAKVERKLGIKNNEVAS